MRSNTLSHDDQPQKTVLAELKWEPSITAAHIGVTADNDTVNRADLRRDVVPSRIWRGEWGVYSPRSGRWMDVVCNGTRGHAVHLCPDRDKA